MFFRLIGHSFTDSFVKMKSFLRMWKTVVVLCVGYIHKKSSFNS